MIFIRIILFSLLTAISSCHGQDQQPPENKSEQNNTEIIGDTVEGLGKNIGCMIQDKENNYWFASNGGGLYRYDGKTLMNITEEDGLISNFVLKIEEDLQGDLWISTRDGVCRFDGVSFSNYSDKIKNAARGKLNYSKGGLFFGHMDGLCFYDGKSFTGFTIHPDTYSPSASDMNRPYSVYSTLVDKAGNVWFGTQEKGVCLYDGNSFSYFTGQGLDKAAVRTLFQDKAGNIWAGNNGAGLFRFNGKEFVNFT